MKYYLDYAATTPLDTEVLEAMTPFLTSTFYNPGAIYQGGVEAKQSIEEARSLVASVLSARPSEILFVDGGSEANNLALLGTVRKWQQDHPNLRAHVITTNIEHPSVLEVCKALETDCDVTYLAVDEAGKIDLKELKAALQEHTVIVSVGYGNGEIGVLQDIKEIAKTIRHFRKHNESSYPYLHTDAIQVANTLSLNVLSLGVDLLTLSGSKIYGPKKIASLYVKSGTLLAPLMHGGDQESGYRPGTENVPGIVGYAVALKKAQESAESESARLVELRDFFVNELSTIPEILFNSQARENSLPHIVNITIPHLSSEEVVLRLDAKGIACSVKSACKSGEDGDSHVILALRSAQGREKADAGSVRFSLGRFTNKEELTFVANELSTIIQEMMETKEKYGL